MKKILLSGFGPFLSIKQNPSEQLAQEIAQEIKNHQVDFVCLPVSYQKCFPLLKDSLKDHDLVISFGLAQQRDKICLEQKSFFECDPKLLDCDGMSFLDLSHTADHPADRWLSSPIAHILSALNLEDSTFELSLDPGRYVCNYLTYQLYSFSFSHGLPTLFIHVPMPKDWQGKSKLNFHEIKRELKNVIVRIADQLGG